MTIKWLLVYVALSGSGELQFREFDLKLECRQVAEFINEVPRKGLRPAATCIGIAKGPHTGSKPR